MSNTLEHKGYTGSVEFSSEDDVFFGKIIGINDLVTFEGQSVPELKAAFIEAVEDYLATCKKINKEPEKTYKGTFNVRLTPELHKKIAALAIREKMTLNQFIKFALKWVIEHKEDVEPALKEYLEKEEMAT